MPTSTTLAELLLTEQTRPTVVTDLVAIVDAEVSATGGASGLVVKSGYAMAKKSKPGFIPRIVNDVLPEIAEALEPFYAQALADGRTVPDAFAANSKPITAAVVAATEAYVRRPGNETLAKGYKRFSGQAPKTIAQALPKIASMIERYRLA